MPSPIEDHHASSSSPRTIERYLVFEAFARGGMADVHLGRLETSNGLSRVVAVKRLKASGHDEALRARFVEEARLLFRIRHASVVATLDVIQDASTPCLVLEYVHGAPLSELRRAAAERGESIPFGITVAVIADALRGLGAAHDAKDVDGRPLEIVHRDVSPQNVIVGVDGVARILDFGVAKALRPQKLTATGTTLGNVIYMSPEQRKGLSLTPQADLYSAGVVLWECLTGRPYADAIEKNGTAKSARAIAPEIPACLDEIVARAVAESAGSRWRSADEMATALEDAAPRASLREIAEWVERVGGDELERRAELVKRVECHRVSPAEAQPAPAAIEVPQTKEAAAPVTVLGAPSRWRRRATLFLVAASALSLSAAALISRARADHARAVPKAPTTDFQQAATPSPDVVPAAAREAPPPPPPLPIPPEIVTLAEVAPRPHPPRPRERPRAAAPAPRSARPEARSAPSTPECDPPYRFDVDGRKRFKLECLQ